MLGVALKRGEGLLLNIGNENVLLVAREKGPKNVLLGLQAGAKVKVVRLTKERVNGVLNEGKKEK